MELVKSSKDEKVEEHILMLNDPTKKELIDFGNELFPNSAKRQLETLVGEKIEKDRIQTTIKSLSKKYKYVFTEREIYEECLEYNLTFKETSKYNEDFDYFYIEKIKKFIEENDLLVSREELRYNFMVLTKTFGNNNPLIFYKHKEAGTTYYILIEGDLSYKSLFNWFSGYLFSTQNSMQMGFFIISSLIIFFVGSILNYNFNGDFDTLLIVSVISIIIGCFAAALPSEWRDSTFNYYHFGNKLPLSSFNFKSKDLVIIGFWLLSMLSILYFYSTLNYTFNPKEITKSKIQSISHVELRKLGIVPEPNKNYKQVIDYVILKKGNFFYVSDSIILQSEQRIYAAE